MATVTLTATNTTLSVTISGTFCANPTYSTYELSRNGVLYSSGTTGPYGGTLGSSFPIGVYSISVAVFEGDPVSLCDTGTSSEDVAINTILQCIPSTQQNLSFSLLSDFFDIDTTDVELSGPNNPSSGGSLFGLAELPASGTPPNKTRPNAVSELRGVCKFDPEALVTPEVSLAYDVTKFFVDTSGNIYTGTWQRDVYNLTWTSLVSGSTTSCPSSSSSVIISLYLEHYNTSGTVLATTPYFLRILKNNSTVDSISRFAGSNGSASKTVTVSLSQGDQVEVQIDTQVDPFLGNCGRTLNYKYGITILDATLNNSSIFVQSQKIESVRVLDSQPCTSQTTVVYSFNQLKESNTLGIFGELELYVNNSLVDTIQSGVVKSRLVNANTPVKIRTKYTGNTIDSSFSNPQIYNYVQLNTNSPTTTVQSITSGVSSFLESTVTTPSSGTNNLIMNGKLIAQGACGKKYDSGNITAKQFITEYYINLGSSTGNVVFKAYPQSNPDRFQVIWNNQIVIDTGYISTDKASDIPFWLNYINQLLVDLGESPVDEVRRLFWSRDRHTFTKNLASPTIATVKVFSPDVNRTIYSFSLSCPS